MKGMKGGHCGSKGKKTGLGAKAGATRRTAAQAKKGSRNLNG